MSYFLDLIFPKTCCRCGRTGSYLCSACTSGLSRKGISTPKHSRLDGHLSLFRYRGLIKDSIKTLKFGFVSDITNELSSLIVYSLVNNYPHLLRYWQENKYTFVPVPLPPQPQLWRGCNQSAWLAQKVAFSLNMDQNSNLVIRTKNSRPQSLIKDRRQRRRLSSSFCCTSTTTPPNIIIFDDVYTSGSTINSLASTLPSNCHIWGLSLAG